MAWGVSIYITGTSAQSYGANLQRAALCAPGRSPRELNAATMVAWFYMYGARGFLHELRAVLRHTDAISPVAALPVRQLLNFFNKPIRLLVTIIH